MSKFLIICVFLLSFVAVSFCDLIPLPKGTYEFKSNENEKALLYVDSKSLLMLTENKVILSLDLKVDKDGNRFYYLNSKNDYMLIYFDNMCDCTIRTKNNIYFLYNTDCKK